MVDEAHGAGVLGARGAGASELLGVEADVDLRMGTFSKSLASCGGFIAGLARGRRLPAHLLARVPVHGRRRCRPPSAPRWPRCGSIRSDEGPPLFARVLENAALPAATGCATLGFKVVERRTSAITTPIVPVVVGDDWKAVLLWRALYDAGVYVNVALHPAVPPAGALLRTSVMATHDRATLDRALDAFGDVKQRFEAEHGPLPCVSTIVNASSTHRV